MSIAHNPIPSDSDERVWFVTPLGLQRVELQRRWREIETAAETRRQGRAAGTLCAHCPADFEMEHDEETRPVDCTHGGTVAHAQCELAEDDERPRPEEEPFVWDVDPW